MIVPLPTGKQAATECFCISRVIAIDQMDMSKMYSLQKKGYG